MAFLHFAPVASCMCSFVLASLLAILFERVAKRSRVDTRQAPLLVSAQSYLPRAICNAHFALSAAKLLEKGYRKFPGLPFSLTRNDGHIIMLPLDLLHELSSIPPSIASSHGALERDLCGDFTGLNVILESRLHHTIVQRKLTTRLKSLSTSLEDELNDVISSEFPSCEDWTEIQPYALLGKVSARLAAPVMVGTSLCRNSTWQDISINYTESLFRMIVVLRLFPRWLHSFLCHFFPHYWYNRGYIKSAKKLLGPQIETLLKKSDAGELDPDTSDDLNVMTWLADLAKGNDRDAEKLAHIQVLLALASVHTTLLRMVNVLYDLTASPAHIPELQSEINSQRGQWSFGSYDALQRLDSVLRESQRMSPPTLLGMKRLFKAPYTFSNGLHVPKDSYVCMPTMAIENDPLNAPSPDKFDGFRSFRLRQEVGQEDSHQFSSVDATTLNFGFGKTACPGRFFASLVLKMVFVKILTTYEFQFPPGQGRPSNLTAHEFLFTWPWDKILIRRQDQSLCPF